MSRSYVECPDVVIANGQTTSGSITLAAIEDAEAWSLALVSGDAAKTYKLQASNDKGVTWFDYFGDAPSITVLPVSAVGINTYKNPAVNLLRIVASAAVASLTTFKMRKSVYA